MSTYLCAYDGCYYPAHAFSWCTGHYTQATTTGILTPLTDPDAPEPTGVVEKPWATVEELTQALDLELPEDPPAEAPEAEVEAVDAAGVDAAGTSRPKTVRRYYASFAAAFHDQVRPTASCWGWEGATTPNGLPILRVDGESVTTRRYTYEFLHGPIPEGKRLRNRNGCEKTCVNPAHYGHKAA